MARIPQLALGFALTGALLGAPHSPPPRQAKVLVLYGGRAGGPFHRQAAATLHRVLEAAGVRATLSEEFVDESWRAARNGQRPQSGAPRDYLAAKYRDSTLDLVILVGEPALDFYEATGRSLFPRQPSIACLIGSRRIDDFAIDPHLSIVADDFDVRGTVALARRLQPDRRNVVLITGTSPADRSYASSLQSMQPDSSSNVTVVLGKPLVELEDLVLHPPPNSVFIYLTVSADSAGNEYAPADVLERLAPMSKAPMYSWLDVALGDGIVGGRVVRSDSSMAKAAALAARVLAGDRFGSLPRIIESPTATMLDGRELRRWRIDERLVPADAVVLFGEPSVLAAHRVLVALVALLIFTQGLAIAALVTQRLRRRGAESANRALIDDLRASYERIHSLAGRMINAQEEERARIGRELHDDINQKLGALAIALSNLRQRLPAESRELSHEVTRLQNAAAALSVDVRDLSHRLHSGTLHLAGLSAALQTLCSDIRRQNTLIVELSLDGDVDVLPDDVALCLYRVAQEGLRNVVTHAHAALVRLTVARRPNSIVMTVADDGRGFDVAASRVDDGLGLISLEERVHILNGEFRIESRPAHGTTLTATIPLSSAVLSYSPAGPNVATDRSPR
jgi:signal transduction histidine kinase